MFAPWAFAFNWPGQEGHSLVLIAAVASAGLACVLGAVLLGRRRPRQAGDQEKPRRQAAVRDLVFERPGHERRNALRREGSSIAVEVQQADGRVASGWVIDRSLGGLAMQLDAPFEVGALVKVRPAETPRSVPWVQLEVRHCEQINGAWRVGGQFVKTPPYSVLLLFG
jgi:PilZ domain